MADLERLKPAPLLPVAVAVIAGIIATRLCGTLWWAAGLVASAAFLASMRRYLWAGWILAAALGSLSYYICAGVDIDSECVDTQKRYYKATISSVTDNGNSISADIEIIAAGNEPNSLQSVRHLAARLTCPSQPDSLHSGYTITFRGALQPIVEETDLPDEIDPGRLHLNRNIRYRTFTEPSAIVAIEPTPGLIARMQRWRDRIVDAIYCSSLSPATKIFTAVTLLGETSDLPADTRERFSSAGLGHILALSGLHVGIIAMIISFALWPLHAFGQRGAVALITISLLWSYAAVTGMSPSVSRAVIMATIYLLGRAMQRNSSPFNSLAAAAIVILLIDPRALFSAGFQLSFSAVAAIIMFAEKFNPISQRRRLPYTLASYISVSVCAMIGTAIPACIYFHTFPVWFIGANLIASVVLPFFVGGAMILTLCELAGSDPTWLCRTLDFLYSIIDGSAALFGRLPGAVVRNIYLPGLIAGFYGSSVIAFYFWLRRKSIQLCGLTAVLVVATFALGIFKEEPARSPRLYLTRNAYRTDLVIDNCSSTLYIVTSAPQEKLDIISRAKFRYRDYMGRRGIDSVETVNCSSCLKPGFALNDKRLQFGSHSMLIIDGEIKKPKEETVRTRVEYAIVCRGFRGRIIDILKYIEADTLILSSDLHPKRSSRYAEESSRFHQPFIDMRIRRWSLGLD